MRQPAAEHFVHFLNNKPSSDTFPTRSAAADAAHALSSKVLVIDTARVIDIPGVGRTVVEASRQATWATPQARKLSAQAEQGKIQTLGDKIRRDD